MPLSAKLGMLLEIGPPPREDIIIYALRLSWRKRSAYAIATILCGLLHISAAGASGIFASIIG